MFRFHIVTFGCKVNQYESQAVREHWLSLGGVEAAKEAADCLLVAACAVTAEAVSDARQLARKWRRDYPAARVIVTGCAAEAAPQDFEGALVVPQHAKARLVCEHPLTMTAEGEAENSGFPPFRISGFERARPVLKVQDGCSHGCAYCIVPLTRGPARSRDAAEALDEARRLLAAGHREIMISGINLRQYRKDGLNFWGLLRLLNNALEPEWRGTARLRLSSLDPAQLDAEGLETLEACGLLCPHLHLSLQSGSPAVLRRMGRGHYRPEAIPDALGAIRRFWPLFGLGADILTGFPGESDEEAGESLRLVEALPLTYAHVFPWSSRPGTRAADMPDQLPKRVRQERAAAVRAAAEEKRRAFLREQAQRPFCLLALDSADVADVTGQAAGTLRGVNEYYVPCQLRHAAPGRGHELIKARPLGVDAAEQALLASPVELP